MSTPVIHTLKPDTLEQLPVALKRALEINAERLNRYIENMAPSKPIDPAEGGKLQKLLWQVIRETLMQPPEFFSAVYNELLYVVNANKSGCFSKAYANRFYDYLDINSADMKTMPRVINLMLATAEPGVRHLAIKQIDLPRILKYFKDQTAIEKLASFYAI